MTRDTVKKESKLRGSEGTGAHNPDYPQLTLSHTVLLGSETRQEAETRAGTEPLNPYL